MCGRYNITDSPLVQVLLEELGIDIGPVPVRYNIAPTDFAPVIVTEDNRNLSASLMRWWLVPGWSDGPSNKFAMFNARAETLEEKPAYKGLFKHKRCLVPVSSFIERNKQTREYYESFPTEFGFLLAGLWDYWTDAEKEIYSFTIITTEPPESVTAVYPRMPVALTLEEAKMWVDQKTEPTELKNCFEPTLKQPYEVVPLGNKLNGPKIKKPMAPVGKPFYLK